MGHPFEMAEMGGAEGALFQGYIIRCTEIFLDLSPESLDFSIHPALTQHKYKPLLDGTWRALTLLAENNMLQTHIENIGEMAVIECEGRIVRSEDAFRLRDAVNLQSDSRIIVLDLSEVSSIEGGGLGMLVFLQRWACDHDVRLKLFNPRSSVRNRLEHASSIREFEIASLDEMMALIARNDTHYERAA
jgi:anti-anti-sigma regulatory factor